MLDEGGHGIHPCLLEDVDRLLMYDLKPGCIIQDIKNNFPNLPLPSAAQIYNRKAYVRKTCGDSWDVQRQLDEWVAPHLIASKEDYDQIQHLCRPMVLGEFEGVGLNFEEKMVQDNGIVFTFKGITNWWPQLREAQCGTGGLSLSVDGTYKLLLNGWVFLNGWESVPDTDMLASVSWFQLVYQVRSMHEVKYDRTSKGLSAICDCKNYTKCGFCSHCLYVLHMAKEINLQEDSRYRTRGTQEETA